MKDYIRIKVSLLLSEIVIRKLQWVFLTNIHIVHRAWHIMSCTPFMFANVTQTQTWYQRSHHMLLMQNGCLWIRITFDPSLGGLTTCWEDQRPKWNNKRNHKVCWKSHQMKKQPLTHVMSKPHVLKGSPTTCLLTCKSKCISFACNM